MISSLLILSIRVTADAIFAKTITKSLYK